MARNPFHSPKRRDDRPSKALPQLTAIEGKIEPKAPTGIATKASKGAEPKTETIVGPVEKNDVVVAQAAFRVANLKGLHARPCAELARCAGRFRCQIYLIFEGKRVEAKSLLGLLTLAACFGSLIEIEAKGRDAKQAVKSMVELASQQFGLDY